MTCRWAQPLPALRLNEDEVHVWRANLNIAQPEFARLEATVSPDERIRAGQFRFSEDSRTFLVARAILRDIVARYLEVSPAELTFAYEAHGKPTLVPGMGDWLRFNLSHSRNLALYAVARTREVGIDVEWIRPGFSDWQIAHHFFAARETHALQQLDDQLRPGAFFACWTRKEAFVKARGEGLFSGLDAFEVTVAPDQPAALVPGDHNWCLRAIPVGDGFAATCAAQGSDWKLRLWDWAGQHQADCLASAGA